jgi:hypothetical protein
LIWEQICPGAVLVYGPGCGMGKSTNASALTRKLAAKKIPARLVRENEILGLDSFADHIQQVERGRGHDTKTLLKSCRLFIGDLQYRSPEIAVLDSILPCWDWLSTADCSDTAIASFTGELCELLSPLNPLLVFLEGDLNIGLNRALANRGTQRALNLAEERKDRRDINALREYLCSMRETAEQMLSHWEYDIIRVESTQFTLEASVEKIMPAFLTQHCGRK